ncbi:AAA family ATPase [Fulvimarina sp. MAC3]|uniref:AAA family ATPase n=1 Tax=Fulvimarina sp. MAC3 TaxID=3148887 RepID=UPI0031FC3BE5
MPRLIVVTGCSGGGKSTLLAELARRGHLVVEEPGRRIVHSITDPGDPKLPWNDLEAFAKAAAALARTDYDAVRGASGPVFFDRGLVDALSALRAASDRPIDRDMIDRYRYEEYAFFAPPWADIWEGDTERRHGFDAACEEYERLMADYPALGYRPIVLPKASVTERAEFMLEEDGIP